MLTWLSKHVFFPLWELKDGARRLQYLSEMSANQDRDYRFLRELQWTRACQAVKYAFEHCPYYRERFAEAAFKGQLRDWSDFKRLPTLTKADIRRHGTRLQSVEYESSQLVEARTGGSTGIALKVYFDTACQQMRNAAAMRSDHWAGWDIGMKVAAIWGNPPVATTIKSRLRNFLLERTMYLDTMNISVLSVTRFVEQWQRERPQILYGHSHSIYILAKYLRQLSVTSLRPKGIITTSMMLLAPERNFIEQTFDCAVTNRYGCEEVGLIASECERHDGLHLNVDHLVIEFLRDDGSDAEAGEEANIVVTDLINRGMPLIRYVAGDMGVASSRSCTCGRGLPLMERITGRRADFLKRPDGSLVAGVSLVERTLTAIEGIEQMQLVQDDLHRISARIVKEPGFTAESERRLVEELQSVFSDSVVIHVEYAASLDQTTSGKYRFAICNI